MAFGSKQKLPYSDFLCEKAKHFVSLARSEKTGLVLMLMNVRDLKTVKMASKGRLRKEPTV